MNALGDYTTPSSDQFESAFQVGGHQTANKEVIHANRPSFHRRSRADQVRAVVFPTDDDAKLWRQWKARAPESVQARYQFSKDQDRDRRAKAIILSEDIKPWNTGATI